MIHIPRPPTPPPVLVAAAAKEMEAYREFMKFQHSSKKARAARTAGRKATTKKSPSSRSGGFKFKAYRLDPVKASLEAAFHFKCAYCESDYSANANVRVEHFRPKGRVDRQGMKPVKGYYWLAGEWRNLLPSCERCNSPKKDFIPALNRKMTVGKANWFPLWDETKRARKAGEERREYPLLLNPCDEDPEEYLMFDENGMVEPAPWLSKRMKTKAETSISVYGLGRLMLVKARHEYAKRILSQIERVVEDYEDWKLSRRDPERRRRLRREWGELGNFLAPDAPYRGLARVLIARNVTARMRDAIEQIR